MCVFVYVCVCDVKHKSIYIDDLFRVVKTCVEP